MRFPQSVIFVLMRKLFLLLPALLLPLLLLAQKPRVHHGGRTVHTRSNHNYNVIRINRAKARIVCPIFEDSGYPYHGLGIKLGDPFAFTYKFYASKHFSFGVDFGQSASGLYSRYYREVFNEYTEPDTLGPGQSVGYLTHTVKTDWVAEARMLYHMKVEKISPGLQVYVGLGWEVRSLSLQYNYFLNDGPLENKIETFDASRFTYGIQGTIGIEYSYFRLPVSAFMELDVYNDLLKDPGYRKVQGGVGIRYIF